MHKCSNCDREVTQLYLIKEEIINEITNKITFEKKWVCPKCSEKYPEEAKYIFKNDQAKTY